MAAYRVTYREYSRISGHKLDWSMINLRVMYQNIDTIITLRRNFTHAFILAIAFVLWYNKSITYFFE